eukprot:TRINITY_DN67268_c0_g1_i1.p1 TRINITY_DN67268_c0_g1~~TRINITY_DN67268_c0_g1_i1.p1  ORF type:complete len:880 (-),score=160.04 TRINITY_DN67268_c0_g1_i1:155-2794(-)
MALTQVMDLQPPLTVGLAPEGFSAGEAAFEDEADAAAWYAAAAEGYSDDENDDEDPYIAASADPYSVADDASVQEEVVIGVGDDAESTGDVLEAPTDPYLLAVPTAPTLSSLSFSGLQTRLTTEGSQASETNETREGNKEPSALVEESNVPFGEPPLTPPPPPPLPTSLSAVRETTIVDVDDDDETPKRALDATDMPPPKVRRTQASDQGVPAAKEALPDSGEKPPWASARTRSRRQQAQACQLQPEAEIVVSAQSTDLASWPEAAFQTHDAISLTKPQSVSRQPDQDPSQKEPAELQTVSIEAAPTKLVSSQDIEGAELATELPNAGTPLVSTDVGNGDMEAVGDEGTLSAEADVADFDEEVDEELDEDDLDVNGDIVVDDPSWDEKVIVVRQGQVHIELQGRSPRMDDPKLLQFCDWLHEQLPIVVKNFPYIRKSGAYVDLSDNNIGQEGLDKLFRVLRDHRVPCVVMKCYRNVLDDNIIDTLVEYLYTQPEAFPMHGIHISHNCITDKGAFRLIRAAASCGHYPRATTRLPLWLRLECNDVSNPQRVVADCMKEGYNVCLMRDGLCSRSDCNHYSEVHIQLPYFLNQGRYGAYMDENMSANQSVTSNSLDLQAKLQGKSASDADAAPENGLEWRRKYPHAVMVPAPKFVPAPKKAGFRPQAPSSSQAPGASHMGQITLPHAQGQARPSQPFKLTGMHSVSRPPTPSTSSLLPGHPQACQGSNCKANAAKGGKGGWNSNRPGNWSNGNLGKGGNNLRPDGSGGGNKAGGGGNSGGWGGGGWKDKRAQMWQGETLVAKKKKEVTISEGETQLGFTWQMLGEGKAPRVSTTDPNSKVGVLVSPGELMLRMNGLDSAMFTEKQINDILRQRPLTLRFGDA